MKKNFRKSFSLIEVVVSVAIIAMFLGALIPLVNVGAAVSAKKRLQAVDLAREGVELSRQIRDTHRLKNSNNGLSCGVSPGDLLTIPQGNDSLGVGVTADQFERTIAITEAGNGFCNITSTVSWNDVSGTRKSVAVMSYLTKWW